jgi:hypothetical protein
MDIHEQHIRSSIELAKSSTQNGNHPFGALLLSPIGEVLLTAENTVVTQNNPTHHAEMNLINKAWASLAPSQIKEAILYTRSQHHWLIHDLILTFLRMCVCLFRSVASHVPCAREQFSGPEFELWYTHSLLYDWEKLPTISSVSLAVICLIVQTTRLKLSDRFCHWKARLCILTFGNSCSY